MRSCSSRRPLADVIVSSSLFSSEFVRVASAAYALLLFGLIACAATVESRLLRVNLLHRLELLEGERLTLNFTLFRSCSRFVVMMSSGDAQHSRLVFTFHPNRRGGDDSLVDIDTPLTMPSRPRPTGDAHECDEEHTRRIGFSVIVPDASEFLVEAARGQRFLRPRQPDRPDLVLFIPPPPAGACCILRASAVIRQQDESPSLYASNILAHLEATSSIRPRSPSLPSMAPPYTKNVATTRKRPKSGSLEVTHLRLASNGSSAQNVTSEPGPAPKNARFSWTAQVNEAWISTFLVFTIIICAMMLCFVAFGLSLFVCLQSKPKRARPLYTVGSVRS